MKRIILLLCTVMLCAFSVSASGQDTSERLNVLENALKDQSKKIEEQQKTIDELKEQMLIVGPEETSQPAGKLTGLFGGSLMSNPYISMVLDAKGYVSNLKNKELNSRGVPGFTAEGRGLRNGFNTDGAELFIFAPVDPYFNLYANIPVDANGATLEEGYFVTTALPEGFQVKGGRFKSNSSRLNAQHPHAWDFADIALPYKAFLGAEGIGGENGVQLTWLPPLPVYTQLGIEAFQGDNPLLFGTDDNWGPHAFTAFAKVSVDTTDDSTLFAGPWMMLGSTNTHGILPSDATTGNSFGLRGNSALYGMEAVWKWKSGLQGVNVQGEYLYLVQNGDLTETDTTGTAVSVNSLRRHQDGAYFQALYRYERWRAGARYDRLELFANTFDRAGIRQPFSGKPWRATASLEFSPTEFSTIRAQFTNDHSARDGRVNNEGILQFIFTIGAHPAHIF